MKKIIIVTVCFLNVVLMGAQSFEKDMELVHKYFIDAPYISFNIKYQLKENHKADAKILTETQGRYVKENSSYLSVMDKITTLVTPQEIVFIDAEEKRMNVKKIKDKLPENIDFIKLLKLSMPNVEATTVKKESDKNHVIYKIKIKNSDLYPISGYEIEMNTKTNFLERMTLFYKKTIQQNDDYGITGKEIPRLDIVFYDFNKEKNNTLKELQTIYYYTKNNSKLIPTLNFNGYAIKEIF